MIQFAAPDIDDADVAAVTAVLERGWITTGDECMALEGELADYLGAPQVVAMASCTAALETAAAWLRQRLPAGSRVAVPTWTFASSALVLAHQGLAPVLVDVEPETLNVDAAAVDAAGVDAVMAVHFGGVPVSPDVRALGLPVIEDAAHALGAADERGRVWGADTIGAAFSFYATKNLTSAEGGALSTADEELAAFARAFRQHGMSADAWARYRPGAGPRYDVAVAGIKGNLPDVLAALARSQLRRFDASQARRRALMTRYRANLAGALPMVPGEAVEGSADHLAVVRLPDGVDRQKVLAAMSEAKIGTSVHFVPLHHMTWFKEHAEIGPVPTAEAAAPQVLSLPLHTRLSDEDVDRVCDVLLEAAGG